ncbi:MAG: arsenate reductase family protein [Candidatus Kryptoniota bacterium]
MKDITMHRKSTRGIYRKEKAYLMIIMIHSDQSDIIKNPASRGFLAQHISQNSLEEFIDMRSKPSREFGISLKKVEEGDSINIMLEDPNLVKRPIAVKKKTVCSGRNEI